MSIPIVIFHTGGNQDYFKNCVEVSSKNNQVYLIGDDSNKDSFSGNSNVRFFHMNELESEEADEFKRCFVNYSGNGHDYEMYCFLRVFYLKALLIKTGLSWVFHTDSDCVTLVDINKIFPEPKRIAYSIQKVANKFHMVGSIHNSLLNVDFCDKFVQLCFDIYKTGTKFGLIDSKLQWHRQNGIPGGICDMTIYYLLFSEKLLDNVMDLNIPMLVNGDLSVFDHNISDSYGYYGENTYAKHMNAKIVSKINDRYYFDASDGKKIRTLSIHFQGSAKHSLVTFSL
jgi:hypothetical protein